MLQPLAHQLCRRWKGTLPPGSERGQGLRGELAGGRLSEVSHRGPDRLHTFCLGSLFFVVFFFCCSLCQDWPFFQILFIKFYLFFWAYILFFGRRIFWISPRDARPEIVCDFACLLRAIRNVKVGGINRLRLSCRVLTLPRQGPMRGGGAEAGRRSGVRPPEGQTADSGSGKEKR